MPTYYERNKEKCKERAKEWRRKNRERVLAKKAEYREKHRAELLEKSRAYQAANRDKVNAANGEDTYTLSSKKMSLAEKFSQLLASAAIHYNPLADYD